MGLGKAALVILLFLGFIIILPSISTLFQAPEADLAVRLADQIRTLPTIDDQKCKGVSDGVANTLTIMQDMDRTIGTGFGAIQFDVSHCDIVIQYLPILGTYDLLILASRSLDPKNTTSVKVFYEDIFLLSSDFVIINDDVAYKVAFRSTGEMNDALHLARLRSLCGDECYRVVLSGIHWTLRVYMDQYLCDFENWASQYVQFPSRYC